MILVTKKPYFCSSGAIIHWHQQCHIKCICIFILLDIASSLFGVGSTSTTLKVVHVVSWVLSPSNEDTPLPNIWIIHTCDNMFHAFDFALDVGLLDFFWMCCLVHCDLSQSCWNDHFKVEGLHLLWICPNWTHIGVLHKEACWWVCQKLAIDLVQLSFIQNFQNLLVMH